MAVEDLRKEDLTEYYGGVSPLRGARRAKGFVKLDEHGAPIYDNPLFEKEDESSSKDEFDITKTPEFLELFGKDAARALQHEQLQAKNKKGVKVTTLHSKPLSKDSILSHRTDEETGADVYQIMRDNG